MHARLEILISLRDRQPVDAAAAAHVAACAECTAELRRLTALRAQMAALPAFSPPELWHAIEARLGAETAAVPRRRWGNIAAAGSLAALVLALAASFPQYRIVTPVTPARPASSMAPAVARTGAGAAPPLVNLVERSQRLEATLRRLPRRPAVAVVANSAAIDALQSRIQRLDVEIASNADEASDHTRMQELWSQRVSLLNSLFGVRYAEAVHAGYRAADEEGAL